MRTTVEMELPFAVLRNRKFLFSEPCMLRRVAANYRLEIADGTRLDVKLRCGGKSTILQLMRWELYLLQAISA